jgi:hypothetical protein
MPSASDNKYVFSKIKAPAPNSLYDAEASLILLDISIKNPFPYILLGKYE